MSVRLVGHFCSFFSHGKNKFKHTLHRKVNLFSYNCFCDKIRIFVFALLTHTNLLCASLIRLQRRPRVSHKGRTAGPPLGGKKQNRRHFKYEKKNKTHIFGALLNHFFHLHTAAETSWIVCI